MPADKDLYNLHPSKLIMYSTSWCPDCRRTRKFLEDHQANFIEVDIGKDNEAFLFIEQTTRRVRIPTLIFPDGTVMVEPSDEELTEKLR